MGSSPFIRTKAKANGKTVRFCFGAGKLNSKGSSPDVFASEHIKRRHSRNYGFAQTKSGAGEEFKSIMI